MMRHDDGARRPDPSRADSGAGWRDAARHRPAAAASSREATPGRPAPCTGFDHLIVGADMADEARAAVAEGVPVEGICLYPVLDYPGWDNDRHCEVGLLGNPGADGRRPVHASLAGELARQQAILAAEAKGDRRLAGGGGGPASLVTGEAA
jgi:hypothetical protein